MISKGFQKLFLTIKKKEKEKKSDTLTLQVTLKEKEKISSFNAVTKERPPPANDVTVNTSYKKLQNNKFLISPGRSKLTFPSNEEA